MYEGQNYSHFLAPFAHNIQNRTKCIIFQHFLYRFEPSTRQRNKKEHKGLCCSFTFYFHADISTQIPSSKNGLNCVPAPIHPQQMTSGRGRAAHRVSTFSLICVHRRRRGGIVMELAVVGPALRFTREPLRASALPESHYGKLVTVARRRAT